MGQANGSKAWKIYVPAMSPKMQHVDPTDKMLKATQQFKIVDSDDVIFNETFQDLRGRQMSTHPKGRGPSLAKALDVLFINADGPLPTSHRQSKRDAQSTVPTPTAPPQQRKAPTKDVPTTVKDAPPKKKDAPTKSAVKPPTP